MKADHRSAAGTHPAQDSSASSRIGMWLFLASEILLFGGLFLLYSVYRFRHPAEFHAASLQLNRIAGTANTVVLLTSSLAVALSLFHLREKADARGASHFLAAAIALGAVFLVVKGFEWAEKFRTGLFPSSPALLAQSRGEVLYVGLYFAMTGLHALHLIVGIGVLAVMLALLARTGVTPVRGATPGVRGVTPPSRVAQLENAGLYWHLVDIIWIFLFPLFYLIS